ncbi:MAG: tetratricopeptide repeat protein [Lewinellaceae bacterium]|nr:tetratricopeptide repeat protein [Phaeodactylibacter sp.]MCB9040248.1 tetratricopeptide repeat protein [Lewinellaceae bacterium]
MNHLKPILASIFFFSALLLIGQSDSHAQTDSLEQLLKTTLPDTHRVDILNELAWLYKDDGIQKPRDRAQKAVKLARKATYEKGLGDAFTRLGLTYKNEERYDSALVFYNQGLEIRKKMKDHALIASSYLNIGNIYKLKGDLNGAIAIYQEGLGYLTLEEDQEVRAKIYNRLGNIYVDQGDLPAALLQFEEALKLSQNLKDSGLMAGILMSVGELHRKQQHYNLGLEAYSRAMEIYRAKQYPAGIAKCYHNIGNLYFLQNEYDKALDNFNACIRLMKEIGLNRGLDLAYQSIGAVYEAQNELDTALNYYQLSLSLRREAGKTMDVAHALANIGQVKLAQKQYAEALSNFLEALPIVEEQKDRFVLENLYGEIARAYSARNDFKNASFYFTKQAALREQLEEAYRQTVELQLSLEAEKLKRERIENEARIAQQKSEKRTLYIQSVAGILLLAAALIIAVILISRMRAKKELAEKKAELSVVHIDELMQGQELRSAYDKLEGQETERKRIAKDLHDRLGSMLSTIKFYFKALDKRTPFVEEPQHTQFAKAKELLDEACEEIRKVAHNLESGGLKEYGLVRQVAALAENLESSQLLNVHFHAHGLKNRLDFQAERNIYLIIRELVANVLKHANATELTIQLNKLGDTLNIMVEDNGVGFTRESVQHKQSGMGIQNIAGRVKELGGNLSIDSGKGGGTTVSIDLPFKGLSALPDEVEPHLSKS